MIQWVRVRFEAKSVPHRCFTFVFETKDMRRAVGGGLVRPAERP